MLKMKNSRKYLLAGILLFSLAFFVACGDDTLSETTSSDSENTETDSNTENQDEQNDEEDESSKEDKTYTLGDTIKAGDIEITLNSAKFTDPAEYSEANNGKVLTIDVTAKNKGEEQEFVDNTDFSIYDKDGNKLDDYYGYDDMAISDSINSGKQLQGKLYFDVPEQDSYELIYTPTFSFENKEYVFEIKPE